MCRQRWTVRLGEVEPVFGQTGRVVLDITARTAHDGALKWTRAPSTPRAARSIFATLLGRAARAVGDDCERLYGYRPWLLETFVDETEQTGASVRAANWVRVGETCGRGRGDRTHAAPETRKAVYMYALEPAWRARLAAPAPAVAPLAVGDGLDAESWAGHEFGEARLGDARLSARTMGWRAWLQRLVPYLGRRHAEEDLQEELRLHLELERERQRDAGLSEDDAHRAARRRLGNGTLIRERTRDVWVWRWLDDLARDVRYALRGLKRSPGFSTTVVLVLALGIGANTAMFAIVHGMLIRPLPYPDADAIVRVGHVSAASWPAQVVVSNVTLPRLQEEVESFEQLAAYVPRSPIWLGPEGPRTLRGAMVSPALFPLLRAAPHLGRLFVEDDAREGAGRVALLSHGAWTNRYGSDPDVLGASLDLDDEASTVVGVLPERFSFPSPEVEIWTPLVLPAFEPGTIGLNFPALGRLRPGVSPERAAAEVRTVLNADRSPSDPRPRLEARVIPLQEEMVRGYRPALVLLSAVTALMLAIACINVAGLFLAHGVARRRELSVRGALGAGRGRIARQLLTESVALGVAGGALGLAAAALILRGVPALAPGDVPRLDEVGVDGMVLAFGAGLSVVAGLVFGAIPALSWSRLHLVRALGEGSARVVSGFRILSANRIRAALAVTQVALALVLLVGAGLLLRGFVRLVSVDPGYDAGNVLTAQVNHPDLGRLILSGEFEAAGENAGRFSDALRERLARVDALPGIEAVGSSTALPFIYDGWPMPVLVPGRPEPANPLDFPRARVRFASPGYFDVMRLRLRRGRALTRLDGPGSPRVAIVNQTLERELFDGEPAVGGRLQLGPLGGLLQVGSDDELWEVVGVVADVKYEDLAAAESSAAVYVPLRQLEESPFPMLNAPLISVRTTGNPLAVVPFLREAVADVHPRAALDDVTTMEARLSSSVAQPRFQAVFVTSFGAVALLLAMLGVYGLLNYTVAQRRGEIGIRMALGAQVGHVLALVVRQGALLVAAGVGLGLLAAAASSRVLENFLFGVTPGDRVTFLAATLVLIAVALLACWLPARRATRVDPLEVLRFE